MPNLLSTVRKNRVGLASGAMITAAAVTLSTLAFLYDGVATADLHLDDGGVWVTKSDDLLVGHLNFPSRQLDGAVRARPGDFDVLQDGDNVLVHDSSANVLTPVDDAQLAMTGDAALPADAHVALGGSTVGVAGAGFLYAVPVESLVGATFTEDTAVAEISGDADVAVSRDGTAVFAVSAADEQLTTIRLDDSAATPQVVPLAELADDAELSIAAIGSRAAAFDSTNGVLFRADGTAVDIDGGAGGSLQQSSTDNDAVYVTTPTALVRVPLAGGDPETVAEVAEGEPTSPIWLNGCVYSIWSGTGQYVRDCIGDDDDVSLALDVAPTTPLVLRTNRRVVVVNDALAGTVWVVTQEVETVDNWDDIMPPPDVDADEEESEEEEPQFQLPERSADNRAPTAVDDEYGVRPGRTAILRVTENDSDPDGDLLAATLLGSAPSGYIVTPVLGGSALQVAVPANASGAATFGYRVDDGRDASDDANVALTVREASQNEPPVLKRPSTLQVEVGASVTYAALEGWTDPDGDDFYLAQATVEGGDTISFRSNGVIEYRATSGETGLKEVLLTVSDGIDEAEGVLRVDVRPADSLNPVANADRVSATAGVPITISPLANDLSPTGRPLRLAKTDAVQGATVTPDYTANTFDFRADTPDTYYVQYLVTEGARSAVGIVRIDVLAGDVSDLPPVAARDLALLPTGRDVLVDVLSNDSDPTGGILVVQNARTTTGSGISVEVLEHSVLRITDLSGLRAPTTVSYTVSNGAQSAVGEVLVMPVPLPETLRPPVTVDDTATVRAGDVVSVSVLQNDYHPDGDKLTLLPTLAEAKLGGLGTAFVDGDRVRFHAGSEPGMAYVTYDVVDSQLNRVAGYLSIQVLPADAGANSAPRPKPVTARVVAGNTVRIAIPLDGIDTDGDSVELVGLSSNPTKGRVSLGSSWFVYEAYPDTYGRDTFTYVVRDHLGLKAESTVTVGVAAPSFENQAPYAVKDAVTVRPGRVVAAAVTVNDSDPDGDDILIDPDGLIVPDGIEAKIVGGRVVVTAPDGPGDYTLTYTISDTFGATAQGVLLVTVDPNAVARAPIARDDRVPVQSVTADLTAEVAVLDNDEDPDGTIDALTVDVMDSTAKVTASGVVTVKIAPTPQIIRYSITDEDGLVGQAFIFVPGLDTLIPTLISDEPIVVTSGESVSVALADHVQVRSGKQPRISVADSVRTSHSDGSPLIRDERTVQYTSAAGYFGPDTIGVLVTDGTGPDDPEGLSAYVAIPVTVLPAENQSPTLRNASVTVAPGEEASTLNLVKLAFDPDEGDREKLRFSINGSVPAGYSASISGSVLTVSADASVASGAAETIAVDVTDGTTAPGQGTITISTIVSQRPFPVANDDAIPKANQGEKQTVDVLANDFNPFADKGPLKILSVRVDSGRGTAAIEGDRVVITPASDFVGSLLATYRIADSTGSAEREVDGRVTLTVQGKPAAPATPTVTSIQDRTVVLSWTPPANNGAAITGYEVSSPQGYTKACVSTTCTLDGLTNDVEYTFQVVATNEVGDSDPSPLSAPARPDARPDTPAPPALVFGDKNLAVSWTTPNSNGSPVLSYTLEISPAPATGSIQRTGVTGNSLVWEGLENGVAYQVRVQAINRAPEPSQWSPYSATMVPAGVPDAPGQAIGSFAPSVGDQAQIQVSWPAPANTNGDAVADYTVTATGGDGQARSQTVTGTSANFAVGTSSNGYSFSVSARNKAGSSALSAASAPVRAANPPAAPAGVSIAATGNAGQLRVTITPGAWNGNQPGEVTWRWGGGEIQKESESMGSVVGLVNGATNGQPQTIQVNGVSGISGAGPATTSNSAKPWGPLGGYTPSASASGDRIVFGWDISGVLNGQQIQSISFSAAGGDSGSSTSASGSATSGAGYYTTRSFTMTMTTVEGNSATYTASGSTGVNPTRSVTVFKNGGGTGAGCGSASCQFIGVTLTGFAPNTTYSGATWTNCAGYGNECTGGAAMPAQMSSGGFSVTTDGNGSATVNANRFGFPGAKVWAVVDAKTSNELTW